MDQVSKKFQQDVIFLILSARDVALLIPRVNYLLLVALSNRKDGGSSDKEYNCTAKV